MAPLVWDQSGERVYEAGVDRGVLYLHDGTVAAWNGLTSVEESSNVEVKPYYLDGIKYLEVATPNDFEGKLTAFTYPDEFEEVNGVAVASGIAYYDQPPKSFNLSYRTRVGNDVDGNEYGYKIHLLYNVVAQPDSKNYTTLTDEGLSPVEFGWTLTGTPPKNNRYRPTVHISIDSRTTNSAILKALEEKLYGTAETDPVLLSIADIGEYFGYYGALVIVDYGDGTWEAIDQADDYITMLDPTTFQIVGADATFLDPDTYTISSTNIGV